jgi:hypothetical protein
VDGAEVVEFGPTAFFGRPFGFGFGFDVFCAGSGSVVGDFA